MPLTYYDDHPRKDTRWAWAMMITNGSVAVAVATWWSGVSDYLEEPFRWATGEGISPSPPLLEYPYILLWLIPLLSTVIGWIATKIRLVTVAHFVGIYPLLFLSLMLGWYYLTPMHWH